MLTRLLSLASVLLLSITVTGCSDDGVDPPPDVDAAPDVDAPAPGVVDCPTYCSTVTASCADANAQYADEAACMATCQDRAAWDLGTDGDMDGNSIACRIYHATAAAADPATHCVHAGPTGGNVCGSWCDNYCQLQLKNCAGAPNFADDAECQAACALYADTGNAGDTDGDTVQCRIYHTDAAYDDDALHCPHAGVDGGGVCVVL